MKKLLMIICTFLLLCATANATPVNGEDYILDFTWSFDQVTQIVGPNETVILNATLTNSIDSDTYLTKYGAYFDGDSLSGINGGGMSWGTFMPTTTGYVYSSSLDLYNLNLAPGESTTFEFGRFTPPAAGVAAGTYSINYAIFNLVHYVDHDNNNAVVNWVREGGPFSATVDDSVEGSPVPEPATMLLFGLGLLGLAGVNRRKK